MKPLVCGESLQSMSHGGTAMIVGVYDDGVMLRHPSGREHMNSWASMETWRTPNVRKRGNVKGRIRETMASGKQGVLCRLCNGTGKWIPGNNECLDCKTTHNDLNPNL